LLPYLLVNPTIKISLFINELIKTARGTVSKNRAERVVFFGGVSREILKT